MTFEIFRDSRGEYRWRLRSNSGEIIASSAEGYVRKSDAQHGIDLVKLTSSATPVKDLTELRPGAS